MTADRWVWVIWWLAWGVFWLWGSQFDPHCKGLDKVLGEFVGWTTLAIAFAPVFLK